ncbi:TonB-dependent receptor [Sphingomonas morindae]|uniref:TonB-dependent receptor n=1 Tax=Sphingomonas morindae TaxID=1541170 RepID=A0ABY4X7H6_9SPHN|nr:TonB-dependent receptor [Sphingomonas morindae]USI72884.1 TonB-dependent receptor [Sphingomonas morindae]
MDVDLPPRLLGASLALGCFGSVLCPHGVMAAVPEAAPDASDSGATVGLGEGSDGILVRGTYARPDVASSKATAPLLDTPQTINVIDKDVLQKENLLTLRDALSTLPGITFGAGEGGGGFGDSINLRGYSANTDITIDGVRDSAQYSRSDTFNLEQIEVYNGANSAFNGSGSVGGTINLVQKQPRGRSETIISGGLGTANYERATVDSNVRVNELLAVRLNAFYHHNDVPGRDVDRFRRWGVAPSATFGIAGPTRLTLGYVHQHDDNVPQFGIPYYPAAGGPPDGVPYSGYFGYRNLDRQTSTLDQFNMVVAHDFSHRLSLRNLTRYENIRQRTVVDPPQGGVYALNGQCLSNSGVTAARPDGSCSVNIAAAGAPANTVIVPEGYYLPGGPRGLLRETRNQLAYDQVDLRADLETGILHHVAVIGGSATWEKYDLDTGRLFLNADGSNPFAPNGLPLIAISDPSTVTAGPAVVGGRTLAYGSNVYTGPINYIRSGLSHGERTDYAAYAFDTTRIGRFVELNFGVRYERTVGRFRADTVGTAGATLGQITVGGTQTNGQNLFSYRGGIVLKPTEATSVYFSYGNSRTPSISTVNGGCTTGTSGTSSFVDFCSFKPETARTYEVGAKADLFHHHLQLTAAVFRNERGNFRISSNDPALGNVSLQVPDGRSRVDGIALGADGGITRAWHVFANYNYLKSKVMQSLPERCRANPTNVASGCNALFLAAPLVGGPLQQTPKNSGSLFTTYALPFGLEVGYGLTYQGAFAVATNPSALIAGEFPRVKDYWLHRLYASYTFAHRLTGQVNIQNVSNTHYYTAARNNGWAVPGATRSVVFSLSYRI